jgi:phage shock protein E
MSQLLDVRTADEWAEGHVRGALHIDVQEIMNGQLPDTPKDTELLVYCRSGGRAGMAAAVLKRAGFTNVQNIGGLEEALQYGELEAGKN